MTYVEPDVRRIVVVKGRDTAFSHRVRLRADDSIPSTVASISAVLAKAGTTVATITGAWDGSAGALTGTITGASTSSSDLDDDAWSLIISATVDGSAESFFRPVVFVPRENNPSVLIADLLLDYPELSSPLGASTASLIIDRNKAATELDEMLAKEGVELHRVRDREALRQVLARLIVAVANDKAGETTNEPSYRERARELRKDAARLLERTLAYDADQNDVTDTKRVDAANDEHSFFYTGRRS